MRSQARRLAALLGALLALPALAQPPVAPGKLTFDDLFSDARTGRRPGATAWRPGSESLTYLWDDGDGEALWSLDAATGETTKLLGVADLPPAEPDAEPSIDAYHWSPTGDAMVLESGDDLWLFRPGGAVERLTETEGAEEAPTVSPDGRKLAYVRDADLYLLDLSAPAGEREERALTTDGEPDVTLNGTTDWVYWEEIWGRSATGFWWSPDSSRIAYYRFDDTPVAQYTLLPDYTPVYPTPRVQRYPKAGTDNPRVRVGVLDLDSGGTTWLATADPDEETYLARVHWVTRGECVAQVAVERLNREQTELDLLLCGAESGDCSEVLRETHPTWVNLGDDTTFLPDGRFLWASERSGWRHLYLYSLPASAGGAAELVRQLTSGPWAVTSVDHADAERVIATAYGTGLLGPARRRLLEIPLAPAAGEAGEMRELAGAPAPGDGIHGAQPSPDGRYLLHRWSSIDDPGWLRVEETGGAVTATLPSVAPAYDAAALPKWRFLDIPGPDGSRLPAMMLEPADGGGGKHPVVMYHYGGPGSQVVIDSWSSRGLWHKMMAQRGYGVLVVDNQASVYFGKAGEDRLHRRFGEVNLAAQKAAVAYLGTLPWADASRIGLWGWSGGGANTLYCLLNSPGTWHAAVAGAPVTDWHYYDTIWTERYLDRPQDNEDGYRDSSAVTYADHLKDRLLIVHGTADDNVHPQNTMALVRKWIDAGIPFEIAIYPGEKHGFRSAASRHFYERMTEFFERTLR